MSFVSIKDARSSLDEGMGLQLRSTEGQTTSRRTSVFDENDAGVSVGEGEKGIVKTMPILASTAGSGPEMQSNVRSRFQFLSRYSNSNEHSAEVSQERPGEVQTSPLPKSLGLQRGATMLDTLGVQGDDRVSHSQVPISLSIHLQVEGRTYPALNCHEEMACRE